MCIDIHRHTPPIHVIREIICNEPYRNVWGNLCKVAIYGEELQNIRLACWWSRTDTSCSLAVICISVQNKIWAHSTYSALGIVGQSAVAWGSPRVLTLSRSCSVETTLFTVHWQQKTEKDEEYHILLLVVWTGCGALWGCVAVWWPELTNCWM